MHVPSGGSKKVTLFAVAGLTVLIGIAVVAFMATRSSDKKKRVPAPEASQPIPEPRPMPMPIEVPTGGAAPPPVAATPIAPGAASPASDPGVKPVTPALPQEIAHPAVIQAGGIRPAEAAGLVFPVQRPKVESVRGLADTDVRYASEHLLPLAQKCFDLRADRRTGGRITLAFTIVVNGGSAKIKNGEIADSTVEDVSVNDCMKHALTTASFPMPSSEGEMVVTYPIDFPGGS